MSADEMATVKKMYERCEQFGKKIKGTPRRAYMREIDMTNDSGLFNGEGGFPVYEGRMVDHFDHRAKTYVSGHGNSAVWESQRFGSAGKGIAPQWFIKESDLPAKVRPRVDLYRIGFCHVANPRNSRSFTSTLLPPNVVCGKGVPSLVGCCELFGY
jgi:hypothetical protein